MAEKSTRPKIIVGMPAYNEAPYIGSLVLQAKQYADQVVIADDGSTDATARIAEAAGAAVVKHAVNQGYGAAIRTLLAEAGRRQADILVILDADSQHDPAEIPSLIKAVRGGADVVIGSREMKENVIPAYRRLGQRVLSRMTAIASGRKLSDTESGFRAYSKKAINTLELKEKGMAVSSEIITEAVSKGLRVTEVPISVSYTPDGSTLNPIKHGAGVMNRILVILSERRPLLYFGTAGAILIILGIVAGIVVWRTVAASQILNTGTALISMLLITVGVLSIFTGVILNVLVKRLSPPRG